MEIRKKNRLKDYDYSQNGAYFITVCTQERKCILSTICVGGGALDAPIVQLTEYGLQVEKEIIKMNMLYDSIQVTNYVIMPNHIHLILFIENGRSGAPAPTRANAQLPAYISTLKRFCNKAYGKNVWQRSYYDHIIRNEDDYIEKRRYIQENPYRWCEDEYYL